MEHKRRSLNKSFSDKTLSSKIGVVRNASHKNQEKKIMEPERIKLCESPLRVFRSRRPKILNSTNISQKSETQSRVTPINISRKLIDQARSSNAFGEKLTSYKRIEKCSSRKQERSLSSKRTQYKLTKKLNIDSQFKVKNELFIRSLQRSNGFLCKIENFSRFKYFVSPGNNSELIIEIMKNRYNWKRIYTYKRAHFIWTPWLNNSVLPTLSSQEVENDYVITKFNSDHPFPDSFAYEIFPSKELSLSNVKLYNKLPGNHELTTKKSLYYNMLEFYNKKKIDPFSKIPLTFHIRTGSYDINFRAFYAKFIDNHHRDLPNIWIVKPGENTNRGFGIKVCSKIDEIIDCVNEYSVENNRTFIVQKYIDNPLLYVGRKFDIRCYALITAFQNNIQAFYYKEGYIRTCAEKFSLKNVKNNFIHLTNDAIQKHSNGYGKFENANKLSYSHFQEYLDSFQGGVSFYSHILPQIKAIILDTVIASHAKLNPGRRVQCFEVLGYDFMIDSNYKVWLIEVNTNPCLELVSPYLEILIPKMIENAFALTIDQFFFGNSYLQNDFEMIFNQASYL